MIQKSLSVLIKIFLLIILILLLIRFFNLNYNAEPKCTGLNQDGFKECPETANCVSSMSKQPDKKIDPIPYTERFDYVRDRLTIVFHQLGAKLIKSDTNYFHYEFRTFPLGFIDDVEVYIDSKSNLIHLKSASRLGRYDFGTNRRRLNKFISTYDMIE